MLELSFWCTQATHPASEPFIGKKEEIAKYDNWRQHDKGEKLIEGDVAIELQANLGLSVPQIWANLCLLRK